MSRRVPGEGGRRPPRGRPPADHLRGRAPSAPAAEAARPLVGTSGYAYEEWRGAFYPDDLPARRMLAYYAAHLPTVELNHTFYRMPTAEALAQAAAAVPAGFRFAVKAPRRITHVARLGHKGDVREPLATFVRAVAGGLGPRLGPLLFQLPPFEKVNLPIVVDLLDEIGRLRSDVRVALEFRHPSWFVDEVFAALAARGAAMVVAEGDKLSTPLLATARWAYLRLRRPDYTAAELRRWAAWIEAQRFDEVYVYFKHEAAGRAPRLAEELLAHLGEKSG